MESNWDISDADLRRVKRLGELRDEMCKLTREIPKDCAKDLAFTFCVSIATSAAGRRADTMMKRVVKQMKNNNESMDRRQKELEDEERLRKRIGD